MALTEQQANEIIRRLTLDFYGEAGQKIGDLNITYRPNRLSRSEFKRMEALAEQADEDDSGHELARLLCRAVLGWDYLQPDGTPFPVTLDAMDRLGYPIQQEIVREMLAAPTPTNGRKPGRGSVENRILPPIESTASTSLATGEERSMSAY